MKRKKVCLSLLAMVGFLALADVEKPVVYVDDFIPVPGEGCQIGKAELQVLKDRVIGNVVSSRKYEVVERENLAKVQKELRLVDAGVTEGDGLESNKLKAAGYIVYGKVVQYRSTSYSAEIGVGLTTKRVDGTVEVQIRFVNIQNGRQLAAKTIKRVATKVGNNAMANNKNVELDALTDGIDQVAKEIVVKLNDIAFPVTVLSANSRFVTCNISEEQVTIGDVWEVFVLGDELKDPKTGESLGFDEDLIAAVRVSRPNAKTTKFVYGADDAAAEKDKKAILAAKEDGEKMILRKREQVTKKVTEKHSSLRDMM